MGKKDLWQSDYFDDKRRFADIFNGALFKGEQIMNAEELEEVDSKLVHHEKSGEAVNVIRDKVYRWKGQPMSIYVSENQSSFFKTENRIIFELLSCAKDKIKMEKIIRKNKYILDKETTKTIFGMLGIKINLNKIMINTEEGVRFDMCKAWDDHKESGRREEQKEGLISLVNILATIFSDFDTIYNKIISDKKYQNVSREQVEKYYSR